MMDYTQTHHTSKKYTSICQVSWTLNLHSLGAPTNMICARHDLWFAKPDTYVTTSAEELKCMRKYHKAIWYIKHSGQDSLQNITQLPIPSMYNCKSQRQYVYHQARMQPTESSVCGLAEVHRPPVQSVHPTVVLSHP